MADTMSDDKETRVHPWHSPENAKIKLQPEHGVITTLGLAEAPMERQFKAVDIIAMGFNISNSWAAVAASVVIAIYSGGSVTLLYGILIVTVTMGSIGLTLAELAGVYPTAGGQYHFTSILAPKRCTWFLSYACGLSGVFSWVAVSSDLCLITTQILMAIVIRYNPSYVPEMWHYFLVYQALMIQSILYNLFILRRTLWIYSIGCKWCIRCSSLYGAGFVPERTEFYDGPCVDRR